MEIKLHNTLTGNKEIFVPQNPSEVTMYHCGPTVYNNVHLGNLRAFVFADTLRRTMEYAGYNVRQVMNITDVDDKTIIKSQVENMPLDQLTQKYTSAFLDDLHKLNVLTPKMMPRATQHIQDMIDLIEILIKKNVAYVSDDGVYFSIDSYKEYGALAGLKDVHQQKIQRATVDEYDKENVMDFVLWKFTTEKDGVVSWPAPFGAGRPGWHIECSAMSMNALGPTIDIHTGGIDLVFPHHTNEIAQSECATGKTFVHYWLHNNFITIDGTKFSKSLGNEIKLDDLVAQGIPPLAYRYWLLTSHYRTLSNFTHGAIRASASALEKLVSTLSKMSASTSSQDFPSGSAVGTINLDYKQRFESSITDDINTPQALAIIWEVLKDPALSDAEKRATIFSFDTILGLDLDRSSSLFSHTRPIEHSDLPQFIATLIDQREKARKERDFGQADTLRSQIQAQGYTLEDTPNGPIVNKISE